MLKPVNGPLEGKAFRFAPGRDGEPLAAFWKFWTQGSEVYALSRGFGGGCKISAHQSGQIHCRYKRGATEKQEFAPSMQIGTGPWMHAVEIRFGASEGAHRPYREREALKNKPARLMRVPEGFVLYANLIIAPSGTPLDQSLPGEFLPAGEALWRARLRDGRLAVLVGRLLELDHFPKNPSRTGFPMLANSDSLFPAESGGWDGQAIQLGFA